MAAQRPHSRVQPGHLDQPHGPPQAQAAPAPRGDRQAGVEVGGDGSHDRALALYFKDGRAKAEIALARGKKEYDKRQTLREKQDRRESDRAIAAAKRKQRGE